MANIAKHKFVSAKSQSPDNTLVSKNEWNDEHVFAGGTDGQLLMYAAAQSDKVAWYSLPIIDVSRPPYNVLPGASDVTAGLQAAVDAAIALNGATVFIPPSASSYRVEGTVTILGFGVKIVGGSNRGTNLTKINAGNIFTVGDGTSSYRDNCFEDLLLTNNAGTGWCIEALTSANIRVDRCQFSTDNTGVNGGIHLNTSICPTITNCVFGSIRGQAIRVNSAHGAYIAGNRIDGQGSAAGTGIYNNTTTTVTAVGNVIESLAVGVHVFGGRSTNIIGNYFEACGYDLYQESTSFGVHFTNNGCATETQSVAVDLTGTVNGFSVRNNTFQSTHSSNAPIRGTANCFDGIIGPDQVADTSPFTGSLGADCILISNGRLLVGFTATAGLPTTRVVSTGIVNLENTGVTTLSSGTGTVKMGTAVNADNARWIPIMHQGVEYFVPAWTDATP